MERFVRSTTAGGRKLVHRPAAASASQSPIDAEGKGNIRREQFTRRVVYRDRMRSRSISSTRKLLLETTTQLKPLRWRLDFSASCFSDFR